ncbi:hypothetical protein [Photobacterium phosphoreum]|uniref:hypothetical protein n=1 Tax=Photobacterium phosphoreum TaxID=659 RepID=UPI001E2E8A29|nr:hypothetical protein [Photobacterium phosphoreum]MCD9471328.1 hypothetical protein [Photobacterium phosphoreum]
MFNLKRSRSAGLLICSFIVTMTPFKSEARKGFKSGLGARSINGFKEYTSNTLTPIKLEQCLNLESQIGKSEKNLNRSNTQRKNQGKSLDKLESEVSSLGYYLDFNKNKTFYSQSEVDSFNKKVSQYNNLTAKYNLQLELYRKLEVPHNKKIDSHNSQVNNFQISCARKRYYEDDLEKIQNKY